MARKIHDPAQDFEPEPEVLPKKHAPPVHRPVVEELKPFFSVEGKRFEWEGIPEKDQSITGYRITADGIIVSTPFGRKYEKVGALPFKELVNPQMVSGMDTGAEKEL